MNSAFYFRGYRVAYFEGGHFEFDCENKAGLPNCNMPSWTPSDLSLFSEWLRQCSYAIRVGQPLPDDVELN